MAMTYDVSKTSTTVGATGAIAEAAGAIGVIVLSIIALAQAPASATIVAVTVIVLGAALLAEGGAWAGEFSRLVNFSGGVTSMETQVHGASLQLVGGGTALVLGILALLGVAPGTLPAAAVIMVGGVLLLSAGTIPQLRQARAQLAGASEFTQTIWRSAVNGIAGAEILCGIAAIVLGILALSTGYLDSMRQMTMVGTLVLGGAMVFGVTATSGSLMRFFK